MGGGGGVFDSKSLMLQKSGKEFWGDLEAGISPGGVALASVKINFHTQQRGTRKVSLNLLFRLESRC